MTSLRSAATRSAAALALVASSSARLAGQSMDSTVVDSTRHLAPIAVGVSAPLRSIGSTRRSVDSSDVHGGARPRTLSELLQARLPGVSVLRYGGDPSDGSRVRVRGATSAIGAPEPILVVDGIPVNAPELLGPESSLSASSRFDDFDPEEIERVDVLPGPAATTLFGAGASNGAIVVTTNRGAPGRPRWRGWSQGALSSNRATYPANYRMNGIDPTTGAASVRCDVTMIAAQRCSPTTLDVWNPLEAASPFRVGRYGAAGGSVAGGPFGIKAYASALGRTETSVLDESGASRVNGRLNAERSLGPLTLAGNLGYVRRSASIRLDNVVARGLAGEAVDDELRGYSSQFYPGATGDRNADRLSRSARAEWRVMSWLRVHAIAGRDEVTQREGRRYPAIENRSIGQRSTTRHWLASSIVNGTAEAEHRVGRSVGLRTLISYEELHRRTAEEQWTMADSPPSVCSTTICGSPLFTSGTWTWSSVRSWMFQERAAIGDRLFLNVGARRIAEERSDGGGRWHASVDGAWDVGHVAGPASLRLRGAYAVGVPREVGPFFTVVPTQTYGPPQFTPIEPEQPREAEVGVDAVLGTRARLNATFFDERTPKLIVLGPVSSSLGFGTGVYLGRMQNQGLELMGRLSLVDRPTTRWSATMTLTALRNRVSGLDAVPPWVGNGPGIRNGQPYGVFVTQRFTFVDADGDGLPSASEITLAAAEPSGTAYPTREASLRSQLGLARWGLALSAAIDHRSGHRAYDMSEYYNCLARGCRAWQDPSAPLTEQVEVVATSMSGMTSFALEDASYARLAELTVEWTPSARSGSVLSGLTIGVEARNVVTWTSFDGPDPEVATTSTARRGRQGIEMVPALPRIIGVRVELSPR